MLCVRVFGPYDHRAKDKHGEWLVCLDPNSKRHSDAERRQEAYLVDRPLPDSPGEYRHTCYRLDGDRGSPEQTELVGHTHAHSYSEFDCARLSGLGRLILRPRYL